MKTLFILFGLLTLFLGLLPFLQGISFLTFLEFIPSSGTTYSIIITVVGALALFMGFKKKD